MPPKGRIVVNENYCKGCEECVTSCPQHVLALDHDHITAKGYHCRADRRGLHRLWYLRCSLSGCSDHRLSH